MVALVEKGVVYLEDKIVVDRGISFNKHVVGNVLRKMARNMPNIMMLLEQVEGIYITNEETQYLSYLEELMDMNTWGSTWKKDFLKIYSFDKQKGTSIHGFSFPEKRVILINMHQIKQTAKEYEAFADSDVHTQRCDYRYYAKDSHYEDLSIWMKNKKGISNFLFWHSLFEQLRNMEQELQEVNPQAYGYRETGSVKVNDMIGFSKEMYQQFIAHERAVL